jgi:hypothetical protein
MYIEKEIGRNIAIMSIEKLLAIPHFFFFYIFQFMEQYSNSDKNMEKNCIMKKKIVFESSIKLCVKNLFCGNS